MDEREPGAGRSYLTEIHLELVAVLVVICVALALFGWTLRPQSGGFPTVPENISIFINDARITSAYTSMARLGDNGAQLTLYSSNALQAASSAPWSVQIDNIGSGHVCTPGSYITNGGGSVTKLGVFRITHPKLPILEGGTPPKVTEVTGSGIVYLKLCWPSGGPISLNGSYLSAQFPPEAKGDFRPMKMTRVLYPNAGDTANYVIQSPTQPNGIQADSWQWTGAIAPYTPLHLSAIDVSGNQHDSYRAFLSGIVFGIAGGALISLIAELVGPLSRRREGKVTPG
jgi:hypothetical protein